GLGDFLVGGILALPGHETEVAPIRRLAVIGGKPYEAHVYGARSHQGTRRNELLQGIAIGNQLALEEPAPQRPGAQAGGTQAPAAGKAAVNSSTLGTKRI